MKRMIAMLVMGGALAFSTIGCGPAATTETKNTTARPGDKETQKTGTVKSATNDKLTLADGKVITVPTDVKPTLDGKEMKLEDLKDGNAVTITMMGEKVTKVEAKK